jgi:NAD(P)H dehydrogenase (quinone)
MAKVLVLYYSAWGHMEAMAYAAAEGAKSAGATVDVKRVAETVPEDIQKAYHYKMDQKAPVATVDDLANYDAIIFATGTRYGMMTAQMKNLLDQTGGLWMKGALVGKVGSWRPGIHHPVVPHGAAAPWLCDCGPSLRLSGPDGP